MLSLSKNDPQSDAQRTPKIVPKSILGPPWAPRWALDAPRRLQRPKLHDFWSTLDPFWTVFWQNLDRIWIEIEANFNETANWFAILLVLIWDRSLTNYQLNQHAARLLCLWWDIPSSKNHVKYQRINIGPVLNDVRIWNVITLGNNVRIWKVIKLGKHQQG